MKFEERFYYNKELEMALNEFFGVKFRGGKSKYYGLAAAFSDPKFTKKAMKDVIKKIRKRVDELIPEDERLKEMILIELDYLEKTVDKIDKENVDWRIIASLIHLIATLLGYDWLYGIPNRHVIYSQTENQKRIDYKNKNSDEYKKFLEGLLGKTNCTLDERKRIILELKDSGFTIPHIALIMNTSEWKIQKIIKK